MKDKIKNNSQIKDICNRLQADNKKIVFTNGCFDILHIGHVRYLYRAKQKGDILLVAVNSDKSVRDLKGPTRPIIEEDQRIEVLAALEMVDYVTLFNETTCSKLLKEIKPDIYVKGGDYTPESLPEWSVVKKYGGRVEFIKEIEGISTSNILKKI